MLTWLVIGSNGYCGQLPKKRELRAGMGKPRAQFPPSKEAKGAAAQNHASPGSHRRLGCCHRNTRCTRGTEMKHPSQTGPSRLGLLPRSPWQHARAASDAQGGGARGYSLHRSGARGCGVRCCRARRRRSHLPSLALWPRCAAREVEPRASPLPARTLSSPRGLKVNAQALPAPSLRVKREAIG